MQALNIPSFNSLSVGTKEGCSIAGPILDWLLAVLPTAGDAVFGIHCNACQVSSQREENPNACRVSLTSWHSLVGLQSLR